MFHVLNRAVGRMTLFEKAGDYEAFERVLIHTCGRVPGVSLLSYCIMPNHWHLLVRPKRAGELSDFMRLLTVTHTQRYHAHYHTSGTGPLYQGRYKSFPIEDELYFMTAARYVEQNALRAGLVGRAEDWRWGSLAVRRSGPEEVAAVLRDWPVPGGVPPGWLRTVNAPLPMKEVEVLRVSVQRGRPYGAAAWVDATASKFGVESSLRAPGRPRRK